MHTQLCWPRKMREMHSHHFDSTIWNDFEFRDDDIVIASFGKAGTTWMQQIVGQFVFNGEENIAVSELSPWLDLRFPPKEVKLQAVNAQKNRRFIKTHLPVDALVFNPDAKYIYIARDGRDILWSLYNHHAKANAKWYEALNGPGLVGEPVPHVDMDVVPYFRRWLERDGYPFWSLWENVRSWWAVRELPNVLLVHYAHLKRDLSGEMRRIAGFLDIDIAEGDWPKLVEHCTFDYMKKHAANAAPLSGAIWEGGADSFIFKGTNGRWRDLLTKKDVEAYGARALKELGPECAHWLASGETSAAK
ncbi:MAG TPA: sulfotransferase domain-containing protein [Rhizomicrobium sp.]|nr:sulfotransferase domain-containing protein [Rhizomicrobium sp.]